mgnify:CR=1 FL=1
MYQNNFSDDCMNKTLFTELVEKTGQKQKAIDLAYAVLVEEKRVSEVAAEYQVSRQLVEHAVNRIVRQERMIASVPNDWVKIAVFLPPELAKAVIWIQEQEKYKAGIIVRTKLEKPIITVEQIELLADLMIK